MTEWWMSKAIFSADKCKFDSQQKIQSKLMNLYTKYYSKIWKKCNPENTFINYKKGELNSTTSLKNAINKQLMAVCF